jgi:hypothetical protein
MLLHQSARFNRTLRCALAAISLSAASGNADAFASDLTIEVGGDLLEHGDVVIVYTIPTTAEVWSKIVRDDSSSSSIRVNDRHAQVQLRYPAKGNVTYRFRPIVGTPRADAHATQVLTIIGTDTADRGPQMTIGFKDAYSDGGRIIRVPPIAELFGPDESVRTAARWGETEGYDAVPPADERGARALVSVIEHGRERPTFECEGGARVQVCTITRDQWTGLEARWWRAIAEDRLERLTHYALRRCYDSTWFGGGTCISDPSSNEPAFQYQD